MIENPAETSVSAVDPMSDITPCRVWHRPGLTIVDLGATQGGPNGTIIEDVCYSS